MCGLKLTVGNIQNTPVGNMEITKSSMIGLRFKFESGPQMVYLKERLWITTCGWLGELEDIPKNHTENKLIQPQQSP